MAENSTKIVLTAEDRTSAALQSVTRGLQGMQAQADLAGRALGALGVTFSAAAAVAFVKGTIDAADGMNDLSQKVGIGIRQLAGWTLAANQSGTSMESVARGIKGLSGYMVEHGDKLRAAGITATDANGAMIQLADLFSALPDGVQKTTLAVQLFGKAGMDMIPMLNQGSAGLAEAQEKADAYGKKMAELAPMADKFNDEIAELALQSKAAGINITQFFIPGLIGLSKWLNDVAAGGERALNASEWMFGERYTRALALSGRVSAGSRTAAGRIGGPAGPTQADEEALAASNMAGMAAAGLLDKGGAARAGKASRFDPFGDFEQKFADMNEKAKRARMDAADKEMEAIDAKARAMDEAHMKRMEAYRIETEGEEAIREAMEKTRKTGEDAFAGLKSAVESWGNKAADTFAEFAVTGKASFGDLVNSMLMDIARLQAKKMLDPITKGASDWLGGAFSSGLGGLFGGGAAASEWDFGPSMPDLGLSFAGGGYTGGGPRSGGLDGQGGFMAMLHPQESVIDHTRGGGGATAPDIIINLVNQTGQPASARQQGAPSFDGSNWVISVVMEAAGSNPGFRAAMGLGR